MLSFTGTPSTAMSGLLHRLRRTPITVAFALAYGASVIGAAWLATPLWVGLLTVFGLGLVLLLGLVWEWSAHLPSRGLTLALVPAALAAWGLTAWAVRSGLPWWIFHPLNTVALLVLTLTAGNWLAAELERPGHLLPVCVIGALADLWSILAGPTRHISQQTVEHVQVAAEQVARGAAPPPPPWLSFLVLQWPQPGGGGMATLLGFGDLVFMALLLAAARRFALPGWRAFGLVAAGLFVSFGLSVFLLRPVPALPAICGLFVVGNLGRLSLARREWVVTAVAAVALTAAVVVAMVR